MMGLQIAMMYANRDYAIDFALPDYPDSLISRARQGELVRFMRSNADFLFTMDDDILLPAFAIWQLANHDLDIVAGVYRTKGDDPHIAVRLPRENLGWGTILRNKLVVSAEYVSTGCMLVARRVVVGMIEKYPELHYNRLQPDDIGWAFYMPYVYEETDGVKEYLSEDWAFCRRALGAGFKVFVDGGVKCAHIGEKIYYFEGMDLEG